MEKNIYIKNPPVNVPQLLYTVRKFAEHDQAIETLCKIIQHQDDRISMLCEMIYKLAPDLEIIETMADSVDEEQKMIERYMNHGNYTD